MGNCLYIVIPAYNEEETIDDVAKSWHAVLQYADPESRLVIIDDGSKDTTYAKLTELKKSLPQLEAVTKANAGHGPTVTYGYHWALDHGADYIFQTDSDGQTLPAEFKQFWDLREQHTAIWGHRKGRQDGASRVFVTKVLKLTIRLIFGVSVPDANVPFRLMNRAVLEKYIDKLPNDFNLPNVLLSVLLMRGKEDIIFIPITFRPRQGGVNSINLRKIFKIGMKAVSDFRILNRQIKS